MRLSWVVDLLLELRPRTRLCILDLLLEVPVKQLAPGRWHLTAAKIAVSVSPSGVRDKV